MGGRDCGNCGKAIHSAPLRSQWVLKVAIWSLQEPEESREQEKEAIAETAQSEKGSCGENPETRGVIPTRKVWEWPAEAGKTLRYQAEFLEQSHKVDRKPAFWLRHQPAPILMAPKTSTVTPIQTMLMMHVV
ncbi:hypothetical protein UY3_02493 [Chelonia mydas]|uniref:Uncharacterized protein n=1 Tax=Chelonia mydas TaxID=8469 RepID=M7BX06_CHEMY|nr:hypothetical protein UY3_02493 [Chelonia mydas]